MEEPQGKERRRRETNLKTGAQIQVLVHLFLVLLLVLLLVVFSTQVSSVA
jgi:cell division septal protein FtsQ